MCEIIDFQSKKNEWHAERNAILDKYKDLDPQQTEDPKNIEDVKRINKQLLDLFGDVDRLNELDHKLKISKRNINLTNTLESKILEN